MRKDSESGSFVIPFPNTYGPVNCCLVRLTGEGGRQEALRAQTQFSGIPVEPGVRIPDSYRYGSASSIKAKLSVSRRKIFISN